jgi:hypothetical protein
MRSLAGTSSLPIREFDEFAIAQLSSHGATPRQLRNAMQHFKEHICVNMSTSSVTFQRRMLRVVFGLTNDRSQEVHKTCPAAASSRPGRRAMIRPTHVLYIHRGPGGTGYICMLWSLPCLKRDSCP